MQVIIRINMELSEFVSFILYFITCLVFYKYIRFLFFLNEDNYVYWVDKKNLDINLF